MNTPLPSLAPASHLAVEAIAAAFRANGLPVLPFTVAGLVALLDRFPVDPNARFPLKPGQEGTVSLLGAVLRMAERSPTAPSHTDWPLAPEGLALPLAHRPAALDSLDLEWLAALLLALGADPWADVTPDDPLGDVLPRALALRWSGLAARAWAHEAGRPSLATLQEARPAGARKSLRGWLDWASEAEGGADVVRWLLAVGVRPAEGPHSLAWASGPLVVDVYRDAGALPAAAGEERKVTQAWDSRLKRGEITPETAVALKTALEEAGQGGVGSDPADLKAQADIAAAMALGSWSDTGVIRPGQRTMAELCQVGPLEKGPHRGRWSLLVALLFQDIRNNWSHAIGALRLGSVLDLPKAPIAVSWSRYPEQALDFRGQEGVLAGALGFEWRPGISINGPLALVLRGYQGSHSNHAAHEFQGLLAMLGIQDFDAWWRAHALDAAAFTRAIAQTQQHARDRLARVWMMILEQHPDCLKGCDGAIPLLIQALHRHWANRWTDTGQTVLDGRPFGYPAAALYGPLLAHVDGPLSLDLRVELALLATPEAVPGLIDLVTLADAGQLLPSHLARVKDLHDFNVKALPALRKKADQKLHPSWERQAYLAAQQADFDTRVRPVLRRILLGGKLPGHGAPAAKALARRL